MLEVSDRSTPTCIIVEAEGPISGTDYDKFAERFEDAVREHGEVGLVIDLKGPVYYGDLSALRDDWRFAFKEYHHARRAAFVGDRHIINAMMRVFSPIERVEDKTFDSGHIDDAIEWAKAA